MEVFTDQTDQIVPPAWKQQHPNVNGVAMRNFTSAFDERIKAEATSKLDLSKQEIIEKLSPAARAVLQKIETHQPTVTKDQYEGLLCELRDMKAISPQEYFLNRPGTMLIPFVSYDGGKTYQAARVPENIQRGLDANETWPCDILSYCNSREFYLKQWISSIIAKMEKTENPMYDCLEPLNAQAGAYSRVTNLIKSMASAG